MQNGNGLGLMIILGVIGIGLFGGTNGTSGPKTTTSKPSYTPPPKTQAQNEADIRYQLNQAQKKAEDLKKQIQAEEDKKTQSIYKNIVNLNYVTRSTDPKKEYLQITVGTTKTPINVTGWTVKSENTGQTVQIPKGTYLYFAGTLNSEEDIYLNSGEKLYLVTGISPNGSSFKVNKCSGYLSQFQTFTPYLYTSCPAPKKEDLSSIPKTVKNDDCLDYIDRFPTCKIQTQNTPANWSYECTNFIYTKINYPSCINTHKGDADFYVKEWRVYLKRSERLWKDRREKIVIYDSVGKIVDTLEY